MTHSHERLSKLIADAVEHRNLRVAVAESLTCGRLASELGLGHDTSNWFGGGIVAYQTDVKQSALGVSPGGVVSAQCAEEMATGCASMFAADVTISTTGVGGPGTEENQPAGTVFIGWYFKGETGNTRHLFAGSPPDVLEQVVSAALTQLYSLVSGERSATD